MTDAFDFTPLLPAGLPAPAVKYSSLPKYNFTGGNNDADQVPVDGLLAAANAVLKREPPTDLGGEFAAYAVLANDPASEVFRQGVGI